MSKTKANIIQLNTGEDIIRKIYIIRDQKVMLDFDLAVLYEVETKYLKRQVRRNIERFPEDFLFELSANEFENLRSQFGTSSWGGSRYKPYAFTEQGVAMVSGVINSQRAIAMNIAIMRAFVEIRKFAVSNKKITEQIKNIFDRIGEHDVQLNSIYEAIENLLDDKADKRIERTSLERQETYWI